MNTIKWEHNIHLLYNMQVGHNIYCLAYQLARHSEQLAWLLCPENAPDEVTRTALAYYQEHTAQIEVGWLACVWSFHLHIFSCFPLTPLPVCLSDCSCRSQNGACHFSDSFDLRLFDARNQTHRFREHGKGCTRLEGDGLLRQMANAIRGDEMAKEIARQIYKGIWQSFTLLIHFQIGLG